MIYLYAKRIGPAPSLLLCPDGAEERGRRFDGTNREGRRVPAVPQPVEDLPPLFAPHNPYEFCHWGSDESARSLYVKFQWYLHR